MRNDARRTLRSFGVASWLIVSLMLAALVAPSWVSAATDDASPIADETYPVETVVATEPDAVETVAATQPDVIETPASSPDDTVGAAAEGDVQAAAALFGLSLSPDPGIVLPSGSTLWTASFGGTWLLEIPKGISIDLTYSWTATPDSASCTGAQCAGPATVSGSTVTQTYSAALFFGGQLIVSLPNPTTGGTYSVTATIYVTSNPSRSDSRTVTFDVPAPTATNTPTETPTNTPTNTPTDTPTNTPTNTPTDTPTNTPTNTPTATVVTPDPGTEGTVNIAKFYCNGVDTTEFYGGEIAAAAIPSSAGECEAGFAEFTFYFVGDQTADYAQLTVVGTGTIGLPAGDYEVVEEGTQARTWITVTDGAIYNMVVLNPSGGILPTIPADQGTVNIAKFYCTGLTEPVWQGTHPEIVAAADIPSTAGECVAGSATFTFYLVGDETAEYAQLVVDGSGTIGLPDGIYEVVEEETQSRAQIEVIAGQITSIVVSNPATRPTPTATTAPTNTPTATATAVPTKAPTKVPPTATATVKIATLPKTGEGTETGDAGIAPSTALLLASISGLMLAGAWELRRRRSS